MSDRADARFWAVPGLEASCLPFFLPVSCSLNVTTLYACSACSVSGSPPSEGALRPRSTGQSCVGKGFPLSDHREENERIVSS